MKTNYKSYFKIVKNRGQTILSFLVEVANLYKVKEMTR